MKKLWQTPELIVLMRGKPEEVVLSVCKLDSPSALNGPYIEYAMCGIEISAGVCDPCNSIGSS